jgi:hypothetical protein
MSLLKTCEGQIVAQLKATLPQDANPSECVEIAAWPDDVKAYQLSGRLGAVLVMYAGDKAVPKDTGGMAYEAVASWRIGITARNLREHGGAYVLAQQVREALVGWQPDAAAGRMRYVETAFTDQGEGLWQYSVELQCPFLYAHMQPLDNDPSITLVTAGSAANAYGSLTVTPNP